MNISDKIKKLRLSVDMSQSQLAEKLCVTRQTVSSWERGASTPDIEMLERISAVFGLTAAELLYPSQNGKGKALFEPVPLRFLFISVVIYFLLLIFGGPLIGIPLFSAVFGGSGGGIANEHFYIVCWGLVLLVGYIAVCICFISDRLAEKIGYFD